MHAVSFTGMRFLFGSMICIRQKACTENEANYLTLRHAFVFFSLLFVEQAVWHGVPVC
jgi:hypothetical protein